MQAFPDPKTVAMKSHRSKSTRNYQEDSSIAERTVAKSHAMEHRDIASPRVQNGEIRVVSLKWRMDGVERKATLRPGQTAVFGRSSRQCTYAVASDPCISGQHFRLECTASEVRLLDLGSRNGTYVNGKEAHSVMVFHRDQIVAGTTLFDLQIAPELCGPE